MFVSNSPNIQIYQELFHINNKIVFACIPCYESCLCRSVCFADLN